MRRHPGAARVPLVSIIVVSWNTRELLRDALSSIRDAPPRAAHEVWVVDNGSTDGSPDMVRRAFPEVRLAANTRNLGFAAANNQAAALAAGDLVLLLNSDTVVRTGAIDALVAHLMASPGVAAVGPRLVGPDGRTQRSCGRAPTPWREIVHLAHLGDLLGGIQEPCERWASGAAREVAVLQGACLLVRRAAYDAAGGLDTGYHMYSEEVELCERLRGLGWRLHWLPTATVMHYGGGSSRLASDRSFRDLYASKVRFFRRNRSQRDVRLFKAGLVAVAIPRVVAGLPAHLRPATRSGPLARRAARYARLVRALPGL